MSYALEVSVGSNAAATAPPHKKQKQIDVDDGLVELIGALEAIDETKPIAKLNATSISDCNGGRIFL